MRYEPTNPRAHQIVAALACVAAGALGSCAGGSAPSARLAVVPPTTVPAADDSTFNSELGMVPSTAPSLASFTSPQADFALSYPATWHREHNPPRSGQEPPVLDLVPDASHGSCELAVDIPSLPFHIPGFLPIGLVGQGFVDDLKTRYKDVQVERIDGPASLGAQAATTVRGTVRDDSVPMAVLATLFVRNDHVYVIDAEYDLADGPQAKQAWETIVSNFRWTK